MQSGYGQVNFPFLKVGNYDQHHFGVVVMEAGNCKAYATSGTICKTQNPHAANCFPSPAMYRDILIECINYSLVRMV
jgi:hypothetical protein